MSERSRASGGAPRGTSGTPERASDGANRETRSGGTGTGRPYVLLSAAMSVDGYLDDASEERLVLSDGEDWDRVDEVRAGCDAILVGANTIRRDNPRLLVRSAERRRARVARGVPPNPVKVTMTARGELDPAARFFTTGESEKIVYAPAGVAGPVGARLAAVATVVGVVGVVGVGVGVGAGDRLDARTVAADLFARGVRRLMVEGGGTIHTAFLTAAIVDEIQLVIAPFFVGDAAAPRFVGPGDFPHSPTRRMRLAALRRIGDQVLARYLLDPDLTPPPSPTTDEPR